MTARARGVARSTFDDVIDCRRRLLTCGHGASALPGQALSGGNELLRKSLMSALLQVESVECRFRFAGAFSREGSSRMNLMEFLLTAPSILFRCCGPWSV